MKQLRVALVGAGSMAARHAAVVDADASALLALVIDRHPQRAARLADRYGAESSNCLEDALHVDAVIVATSTPSHRDSAMPFITAGVPVLVEKPLAASLGEVREMVAAAQVHDRVLMCGLVERFNPRLEAVADHARCGITAIETVRVGQPPVSVHSGIVDDVLLHDLDLVMRLLGRTDHVDVAARAGDWARGAHGPETVTCVLGFGNGATATMRASRVATRRERSFTLMNEAGSCRVDLDRPGSNPLGRQFRDFAHLTLFGTAAERHAESAGILPAHELADRIGALIGEPSCAR